MSGTKILFGALGLAGLALAGWDAKGVDPTELENIDFAWYLVWVWIALVGGITAFYLTIRSVQYVRQIACLNNDTQRYFAIPNISYGRLKRYFIEAPLFRTRHHREFKLSSALNVGTLPSRIQTLFLMGYLGMNVAFCVLWIDFSAKKGDVLDELRNRTGVLSVMNMIPLFVLAARNNIFISICGISFDTFNLIHRWIGRIVVLEALAHVLAYLFAELDEETFAKFVSGLGDSEFMISGTIGIFAFLTLLLTSPSILRHAFYEAFKHTHILVAALAVGVVWIHCKEMKWQMVLNIVIGIWVTERFTRFAVLAYRSIGSRGSTAEIELLPGEAVRITLRLTRPWTFRPGQHVYLYIPRIGWWTSHPFSVAWSADEEVEGAHSAPQQHELSPTPSDSTAEKGLATLPAHHDPDVLSVRRATLSLIVRRRTGFTDKLYRAADLAPHGRLTARCLVEGPYGGQPALASYGTVLLFAAGVGITHQVPHARDLVARYGNGTAATRKVVLVWVIQSPEHLEWVRPWMTAILGMPDRRAVLKILLFVTRPRSNKEIHSPSASVQMFPGRPNVAALVDAELEGRVGAMAVSVCGTGSLADDVRRAARGRMGSHNVDFIENAFSW